MKLAACLILALSASFVSRSYAESLPGLPGVSIEPSRRMQAKGFAWDHEIRIALPRSYSTTDKAYPVLWVTDGSVYFETAARAVNGFVRNHLPEMIVVAIGAPPEASDEYQMRRTYDFTPNETRGFEGFGSELLSREDRAVEERMTAAGMPLPDKRGGAPGFLAFLVDAVRPALSRDYRMTDDHTLFGHSSGGRFCIYALLARPGAFDRYICGSPGLYVGNQELFRMEERYAQTRKDLPAIVFFGAGEAEVLEGGTISAGGVVSSVTRMAELLQLRGYLSLKLHVRIFAGEDHVSVIPWNLSWGLRTVWREEARN